MAGATDLTGPGEILDVLKDRGRRAVAMALKLGADEADVYLTRDIATSIEIENGSVNFSETSSEDGIGLRVLKNGRLGFSYCTSEAKLEATLKNALGYSNYSRTVKYSLPDTGRSGKIQTVPGIFDKRILDLEAREGLDMAKILLDSAMAVDKRIHVSGGGIGFGYEVVAIVNSHGLEAGYFSSGLAASASTIIQSDKDDVSGEGFESKGSRAHDVDLENVGRSASELAVKTLKPRKIEGGELSVVLHPFAFSSLLEFTILPSLYGEAANKGESVYSGRLGELIADERVTIYDDATVPESVGSAPIDDEGLVSRKTRLIEKGILKNYLYDIATACEFGAEPTASGIRAERWDTTSDYHAIPDTVARNIYLKCDISTLDELIADIKDGIFVYTLMGAHTSNSTSGDFSVNSPTLFWIKNGEIASACKPVMLSGNMPELMHSIVGMADDIRDVSGEFHPTTINIGSIRIDSVKVTS